MSGTCMVRACRPRSGFGDQETASPETCHGLALEIQLRYASSGIQASYNSGSLKHHPKRGAIRAWHSGSIRRP
eukprot:3855533-Rhodomonas_salina.7